MDEGESYNNILVRYIFAFYLILIYPREDEDISQSIVFVSEKCVRTANAKLKLTMANMLVFPTNNQKPNAATVLTAL